VDYFNILSQHFPVGIQRYYNESRSGYLIRGPKSNLGPPEYGAGVLIIQSRRSVSNVESVAFLSHKSVLYFLSY
jgi:hypothetical protein